MVFEQVEGEYLSLELPPKAAILELLQQITTVDFNLAQKFWEDYFAGYVWPRNTLYPGGLSSTQRLTLPFRSSLSSIKKLATSQRVTMQALFTCAFGQLLARKVYKQKDVVFGVRLFSVCPIKSLLRICLV